MKEKFNEKRYKANYKKEHYIQFRTDLKKEEMEELNILLKENNLNRADFIRNAIKELKTKCNKR